VVLATDRDRLVVWGPFPSPGPAWEVAQAALSRWRQAAYVTVPGVTDTAVPASGPPRGSAVGDGRLELTAAKPVVEMRTTGDTTRVDDPVHGPLTVDAVAFGVGMAADTADLIERLRRAAPAIALTGHEPHATLAALTALHAPADTNHAAASGPAYAASLDGSVELRDARGATVRPLRPPRHWTPDGFGWGYDGDGPTELACALLADATGSPDLARRLAPLYTTEVTARLPAGQPWTLTVGDVRAWASTAAKTPAHASGQAEVGL
jgi:hypothetical protein